MQMTARFLPYYDSFFPPHHHHQGFVYDRTKVTRAQQHAISRSKGQKAADDVDDEESMSARSSEALSPL